MALRDLTRLLNLIPSACTPESVERNWQQLRVFLQYFYDNFNEVVNNNGLEYGDTNNPDGTPTIPMQAKWAVSMGDVPGPTFIEPVAGNNWRGQIRAFPCANSAGQNIDVNAIWIVLPERTGTAVHLPAGSIFAYEETESGEFVAVSDYSASLKVRWGIAVGNSTDHEVVVQECDDADGNNPVAPNLTILLPTRAGYTHDVSIDDVLAFAEAADGELVCVSDYSLIESVRRFALTGALVPAGNAAGEFVAWNGAAYVGDGTFSTFYDWDSPGRWRGEIGYRGIAVRKKDSARWEIIYLESIAQYAAVELAENMGATAAGESRGAQVLSYWNGNDPGTTVTVWDKHDIFTDLKAGDRLIVGDDWRNNKYFPFDKPTPRPWFWCKAQHQWSTSGYVEVKRLVGIKGTAETGAAFNAYFRMETQNGLKLHDPNVRIGQEIMCTYDLDGTTVIVIDPDAYDRPIGTVELYLYDPRDTGQHKREFYSGSKNISGWGLMDGIGNDTTNAGGINLDVSSRYLFAKALDGDVEADDLIAAGTHTHGLDFPLTMDPLENHVHYMGHICNTANISGVGENYWTDFADEHDDAGQKDVWTGPPQTYCATSHAEGFHEDLTLTPSGSATGTTDSSHSDPAKARLYVLQRCDNSFEALGV